MLFVDRSLSQLDELSYIYISLAIKPEGIKLYGVVRAPIMTSSVIYWRYKAKVEFLNFYFYSY